MLTVNSRTPHLPGTGPALEVEDLCKTYANGTFAVKDLSFSVEPGEIFGLLGPNGAGKSTTLSMLSTTVSPSGGTAYIRGIPLGASRSVRRSIGVAFQDSVLDTEFTGLQNMQLHARLWGMPTREAASRIAQLLEFMGLADRANDNVRTYSGGMRRRLEIARALLAHPTLVLLDEPTVGLDPDVREQIWELIQNIREHERVSIIVSTHYLEEAEAACDRVGIMNCGAMVTTGRPLVLIEELGVEMVEVTSKSDLSHLDFSGWSDSLVPVIRRGTITVPVRQQGQAVLAGLLGYLEEGNCVAERAVLRRTTLADVFLRATHRDTAVDASANASNGLASPSAEGPVAA